MTVELCLLFVSRQGRVFSVDSSAVMLLCLPMLRTFNNRDN